MDFALQGNKVAVKIPEHCILAMVKHMKNAGDNETGGILVGYYAPDHLTAIITDLTGPPSDSQAGPTWFRRGVMGLKNLLRLAWNKKHFYLGEWHYHPKVSFISPSDTDFNGMKIISYSSNYHCPEPIMIIIGGTPKKYTVQAFLTVKATGKTYRMNRMENNV